MIDEEKIKANINSLITLNNLLLAEIKAKTRQIQTKDADMEVFVRDEIMNNKTGKAPTIAKVSAKEAKRVYEEIRILHKRIQDNIVAMRQLINKLSPISLDGIALHDFKAKLLLYRRFIKSGTHITPNTIDETNITTMKENVLKLNLNTVKIKVNVTVPSVTSSTMLVEPAVIDSVNAAIDSIRQGSKANIILEPYPIIAGAAGENTSPALWDPDNIPTWFASWKSVLGQIIDIANKKTISTISIGSEFDKIEVLANESQWIDLLQNIKNIFSGIITYATNINTGAIADKLVNKLFSELDFISISGAALSILTLSADLANIQNFNTAFNKPIFLEAKAIGTPSQKEQNIHYQNIETSFKDTSWMIGFNIYQISDNADGFCPVDKLAEATISNYQFNR